MMADASKPGSNCQKGMPISQFVLEDEPPSARTLIRLQALASSNTARARTTPRRIPPRGADGMARNGMAENGMAKNVMASCYTIYRHAAIQRKCPMQQNWTYYLAFAVGAAILALFYRARRRRSGRNIAVIFAILVIVGVLLFIAVALN